MTVEQAAHSSDGGHPADGGDHLRVVLLGRTGLDASLRDDASIEMVRARTPLEAVGEVAAPPAAVRSMPTVVVVGQDGEPAEQAASFLSAIREANPAVKLIRVGGDRNGTAGADRYDAVLGEGVSSASIRSVLKPEPHASEFDLLDPAGRVVQATGSCDQPARGPEDEPPIVIAKPLANVREAGSLRPGDSGLLEMLQADRGVFERTAVDYVRDRLGVRDVEFLGAGVDDARGVPVVCGKKRFGSLSSDEADRDDLAPHAAWLGAWLSHHERQQSLRRAAFTDPLTGAWNRRYFDGFLASALQRARATRRTVTVLVFDVDGFKQYNDRFGHPAGDEILIETVKALKSSVRPSDRVCRIGGDEFAVIFDEPDGPRAAGSRPPESVYVLAKRVQRKIAERKFPKLGADAPGELTISGGLAAFPWDGHDAVTLLEKADELACQSKRQGKNAITLGPGAERVCRGVDDSIKR